MRRPAVLGVLVLLAMLVAVGGMFVLSQSAGDGAGGEAPSSVSQSPLRQGTNERAPRVRAAGEDGDAAGPTPAPVQRTIYGTVRDPERNGVAGASVSVHPLDPSGRVLSGRAVIDFARVLTTAVAGDDGTYELTFGAAEDLVLVARKDGIGPSATFVTEDDVHNAWLHPGRIREFVVVDGVGAPIAGAEVWTLDSGPVSALAVTDAAGRARLTVTGADWEEVLVHAPGFADGSADTSDGADDDAPIRVVLVEGRSVAGTVVDDAGKPMPGVLVTLRDDALRTAAGGTFAFDGLDAEAQDYGDGPWLRAELDGWCGGEHVDVFPGDLGVRVELRRTATVRGVVVHEDGTPAVGALVRDGPITDAQGRFELANFESGHELVWADAWSPLDPRIPVHGAEYADAPPGGTVEGLRIVLAQDAWTSYVEVRVVDPDGRPAPRADVQAWDGDVKVGDHSTEDDGSRLLRIRGRAGARVRVAASMQGPPPLDAVAVRLVETRSLPPFESVTLQLGPPGRLRLRAVDPEGHDVPIDAAHVDAGRDDVCAPDGTWALPATRSFRATVTVPGFASRSVDLLPPHVRLREETVRLVEACSVTGRVLGPDGRAAVPDLEVWVVVHDVATGAWERGGTSVAEGQFTLPTLPAGPARLYVSDADDEDTLLFRAFDVAAGKTTDLGDLRLAGPTAFRGAVVDEEGVGVGGALITLTDPSGVDVRTPVCTRPDGSFDTEVPGSYPMHLLVTRPGRATQFVATTPATPLPVRVVLGPAGRLRVVEDFNHGPGGRERPAVRPPGTDWEWTPPDAIDPADPQGDLDGDVYGDLPPGPIEVVVRVEGQPDRVRRVEIVAGKTVECVFDK